MTNAVDLISRTKVCQYIAFAQMGFNTDDKTETISKCDVFDILEIIYDYVALLPAEKETEI